MSMRTQPIASATAQTLTLNASQQLPQQAATASVLFDVVFSSVNSQEARQKASNLPAVVAKQLVPLSPTANPAPASTEGVYDYFGVTPTHQVQADEASEHVYDYFGVSKG